MSEKPVLKFNVTIENGKMLMRDREGFQKYLYSLMGEFVLTIKKERKARSDQQNKYYWSVIVQIPADHFGYTPEEMHETFKYMFLRREEQGKPLTIGSTAKTNTKEFTDYIEKIVICLATEYGILLPTPNQIEL